MKKLIIASLTVITTLGISAYTNGKSKPVKEVNHALNTNYVSSESIISASNSMIANQADRANLAQAD